MRWACAVLLLAAPLVAQEETGAARQLVLDASRALQAGNAARFLGYFDKRETPQFEQLRDDVLNLVETKVVASSVEVEETAAEGGEVRLTLDWLLQLTPLRELGRVERRQQQVQVRVRMDKKPKIVRLEPVDFFRLSPP